MWNSHAHKAPLGVPDSFNDDDCALEVVYDAPAASPEEDAQEEERAPTGGFASSAVKPRSRRPALPTSPPSSQGGSPGQAASLRYGGGAEARDSLAQEVNTLLHRTLQSVTQHSPPGRQQQQQATVRGPAAAASAAPAWPGGGGTQNHVVHPPQQQPQQQGAEQEEEGEEEERPSVRRRRRPPMHRSPNVPLPEAAPLAASGHAAPSGGRRWRPAPKPAAQDMWPPQRAQRSGQQQAPAGGPTSHAAAQPAGGEGGWGAPFPAPTARPARQPADDSVQPASQGRRAGRQAQTQGAALAQHAAGGPSEAAGPLLQAEARGAAGGGGGSSFFAVDEDLMAAHLNMPPPPAGAAAAAAAGPAGGGWRQAKRGGNQHAPAHAQPSQVPWGPGPNQAHWPGGGGGAMVAEALPEVAGSQWAGGGRAPAPTQEGPAGAGRNPLAALLDSGTKGRGTAKKKQHPIYGTGHPAAASSQPPARHPLTSPRQQHTRQRFAIKEPATAPRLGARAPDAADTASQQRPAPQAGRPWVQQLTGLDAVAVGRQTDTPDEIDSGDEGLRQGAGPQPPPQQQQQQQAQAQAQQWGPPPGPTAAPLLADQQELLQPGAAAAAAPGTTPGRPVNRGPAAEGALRGCANPLKAGELPHHPVPHCSMPPPPTSYKTPAHQLRQLFHNATPGSRHAGVASTTPGSGERPGTGGGSAGGGDGSGAKGTSLQRQFVATLAPVARTAAAPRQRGGGGSGGLYSRLAAVTAAEKAQREQQGSRAAPAARLTIVQRENEANLAKCTCQLQLEGPGGAAAAAAAPGGQELAGAGVVVALFQSRTAREVDLVPGSMVLVRAPWRVLRVPGCSMLVMLCQAAVQG